MMSNQDLKLSVGLDISTKQGMQQIKDFKQKVEKTTKVDLGFNADTFQSVVTYTNKVGQSFKTLKTEVVDTNGKLVKLEEKISSVGSNFTKVNTSLNQTTTTTQRLRDQYGNLVTRVAEYNAEGHKIVTTVTESKNSLGALEKQTKVYNETTQETIQNSKQVVFDFEQQRIESQKLADEQAKLAKIQKERMADTSKTTNVSQSYINGNKALVTTITELNSKGETTVKRITEYTNAVGQSVKTTEHFDASGKKLSGTLTEISNNARNTSNESKKLGQSFSDVVQKVAKFYLASLPIRMVQQTITDTIETVKEFDKAFTEFAKVTNLAGQELEDYTIKLGELGTAVGRTRTTMVELATGFKKAGFSEEDSANLATYGALLQNTADEQLEASEATSVIVSALKAFNLNAEDTMRILDDINITSQDFAVSSADISRGLTQAGASMSTYGNSLEQTISLLTAGENFLPVTD